MPLAATRIIVPLAQAESLVGGDDRPFPPGPWQGVIEEVRTKPLPSNNGQPFAGYETTDGEILTLILGQNRPLDGQEDVGNRKFFVDIVLRDGNRQMGEVDITEREVPYWQLQRSARIVANLARALGQVEEVQMPDGSTAVAVMEGFVDALAAGQFDGTQIGFEIVHRNFKRKDGTAGVREEIKTFFPVG